MNPATRQVTFESGKAYTLDDHGFLVQSDEWEEEFANGMARLQGIHDGLTKEHWDFIHYIRKKALKDKDLPLLVVACSDNNIRLGRLKALFPSGYFRGACRIAGISFKTLCDLNIWHSYETVPPLLNAYDLDTQGFLKDFDKWDERFANLLSSEWSLPGGLTPKHWDVIRFLRNYYIATHNIPVVFEVCQAHDLELGDLKAMFPGGYRRGACRVAGLPFFA